MKRNTFFLSFFCLFSLLFVNCKKASSLPGIYINETYQLEILETKTFYWKQGERKTIGKWFIQEKKLHLVFDGGIMQVFIIKEKSLINLDTETVFIKID